MTLLKRRLSLPPAASASTGLSNGETAKDGSLAAVNIGAPSEPLRFRLHMSWNECYGTT